MKETFYPHRLLFSITIALLLCSQSFCFGQCKEKISESNRRIIHYHEIPLRGKKEYLTLSRTGEERLLSYHNEEINLVYPLAMFTEIRFISRDGNFTLFTTTVDRTHWRPSFILTSPITPEEQKKMLGTAQIEILLPDRKRIFVVNKSGSELLQKALSCLK